MHMRQPRALLKLAWGGTASGETAADGASATDTGASSETAAVGMCTVGQEIVYFNAVTVEPHKFEADRPTCPTTDRETHERWKTRRFRPQSEMCHTNRVQARRSTSPCVTSVPQVAVEAVAGRSDYWCLRIAAAMTTEVHGEASCAERRWFRPPSIMSQKIESKLATRRLLLRTVLPTCPPQRGSQPQLLASTDCSPAQPLNHTPQRFVAPPAWCSGASAPT
jgi:hypothetical protein